MELLEIMNFRADKKYLARRLLTAPLVDVGEWHAMDVSGVDHLVSHEIQDLTLTLDVCDDQAVWAQIIRPNLPWAEDHFKERVAGEPLNPPPSSNYWPFATGSNKGNDRHKKAGVFSHTYPERFWPKEAGAQGSAFNHGAPKESVKDNWGIRFAYGDFEDLMHLLRRNLYTRQAYLPIWFPEDLHAAVEQERVPCTLGYHFMVREQLRGQVLNCNYYIRSCDFVRYFTDDLYMAGRLMQHIVSLLEPIYPNITTGKLNMHIASFHAFVGDEALLKVVRDGL